jgi:hypothetical protein
MIDMVYKYCFNPKFSGNAKQFENAPGGEASWS